MCIFFYTLFLPNKKSQKFHTVALWYKSKNIEYRWYTTNVSLYGSNHKIKNLRQIVLNYIQLLLQHVTAGK